MGLEESIRPKTGYPLWERPRLQGEVGGSRLLGLLPPCLSVCVGQLDSREEVRLGARFLPSHHGRENPLNAWYTWG